MYIENLLAIMSFVVCTTYLFIDQPDQPHNVASNSWLMYGFYNRCFHTKHVGSSSTWS